MRILFLTHRLPYAPNRGDRVRAFHILRNLGTWARVDVVSLVHDEEEASHAGELTGLANTVTIGRVSRIRNLVRAGLLLPTGTPTTHSLLRSGTVRRDLERIVAHRPPDLVLSYCTGVAPLAESAALARFPLVLDMVDVDSAKWAALSKTSAWPKSWVYRREARVLRRYERAVTARARVTLVVNEQERSMLKEIADSGRIEVLPNGVDVVSLERSKSHGEPATPRIVFCGVMDYAPNVEGVTWFAKAVWPAVRARVPNAEFEIVGSNPAPEVQRLASQAGIRVTGRVPDVRPHLWSASVGVAPLFTARGIQNKVLEALAAGLPVVVTPVVANGLPSEIRGGCLIAGEPGQFTDAVVSLLGLNGAERRKRARDSNIGNLSWETRLAPLRTLLTEVASGGR